MTDPGPTDEVPEVVEPEVPVPVDLGPAPEVEEAEGAKPEEDDAAGAGLDDEDLEKKSIDEMADAAEQDLLLGEGGKLARPEARVGPPPPISFPASAFLNVLAFEQLVENRCENAVFPLLSRLDQCEAEILYERTLANKMRENIEVLKLELNAEKEARAKADAHVLTLFPPIAEEIQICQAGITDALNRVQTVSEAVDEVREMVTTKAEKSALDQLRRDCDRESELNQTRFLENDNRVAEIERQLPAFASKRELKELVSEVDTRLSESIDVVAQDAATATQAVQDDLDEQVSFLKNLVEQVRSKIPPIEKKAEDLKDYVDTIPPKIEDLLLQFKTVQGELMDNSQRITDCKLQIEQVNKMAVKERAARAADPASSGKLAEEVERLKGLRDEIQQIHLGRDALLGDIADVRDAMLLMQKDFRQKQDVLVDADAERAKQTAWLKTQLQLGQEDQESSKTDIDGLKRSMKAVNNTKRMEGEIAYCKSEVKRLTNENKTIEESLKGYYAHVKYMPEHVARRWHAVRKGVDVKLGKEHLAATSQSDNARHGYVPGGSGDHGFVMGDGPCEISPAGQYYEVEVLEKFANVVGMKGGILVGYSTSSPESTTTHITGVVLDGVIVGGIGQVVTLKRTPEGRVTESSAAAGWYSEKIDVGDKIGVLVTVAGVLAIFVNGEITYADSVKVQEDQRVYPLVRIMGNAKSVRLLPGSAPPRDVNQQVTAMKGVV